MGNEESHQAPKYATNPKIQVTGYQQTPPNPNAQQPTTAFSGVNNNPPSGWVQQPTAAFSGANNNPPPGWVAPPTVGNNNAPSQCKVYPDLPPSYNAMHQTKSVQPQMPQQPSAPPMFTPPGTHTGTSMPQQQQQQQQPMFYPQAPTKTQFFAQPVVGSSLTTSSSITAKPSYVPPSNSHSKVPKISNDIWSRGNSIPPNSFRAGHDTDGTVLYICRAAHDGDLLPGKIVSTHNCAYVSYNSKEHTKHAFETLIGDQYRWVPASNGHVPAGAVEGGRTAGGEKLYIGRASYHRSLTPGKIHPSHGCLYIPYGGEEHSFKEYEVLVHSNNKKR